MTEFATTARADQVAYDRYGTGPALIFISGAGPSRASDPITTPTAMAVAEHGIQTLVYDRLGRNESHADGVLDLDRELDALAALIEVAGGSAVLSGHSSGCAIALAAAARGLPVNGLVLFEGPLKPPGSGTDAWSREFGELLDAGELEQAQVLYMKDMPPEWLEGARRSPGWAATYGQAATLRADAEALAWVESAPHAELWAGIRVPVLALVAEQAMPFMTGAADDVAASIPTAVSETVPGARHSWEVPAMVERLVTFMRAL